MSVLKLKQNGVWVPISVGAQGRKGDQGATGPTNKLTIGTVTSGTEVSATITGEAPNQVLNLVLKQGDKGNPGEAAPTITNIAIRQSDYHMIVTLSDGTIYDAGYCQGASGVGIQKVEQTTISNEDGGTNVITVTKTDGSSSTFSVKNGNKGSDGYTPVKGTDYFTEADKNELVNLVLANFSNVSEVGM